MTATIARRAPSLALALALTACAPAREAGREPAPAPAAPAAPAPLRVALDLACEVEGAPAAPDPLLGAAWERLDAAGLRVDVARPVGDADLDARIEAAAARWRREQPGQGPAALVVTGRSTCDYADAAFFGQPQAHTFRGRVDVLVRDASGAEVARLGLAHEWGRLPQRHTKARTLGEYQQMVHLPVVLWLLRQPAVRAGVRAERRAALRAFEVETRDRLLRPLADVDCDVRTLLRGLDDAAPPPGR